MDASGSSEKKLITAYDKIWRRSPPKKTPSEINLHTIRFSFKFLTR